MDDSGRNTKHNIKIFKEPVEHETRMRIQVNPTRSQPFVVRHIGVQILFGVCITQPFRTAKPDQ